MPDCFINYSSEDKELAEFINKELKRHEITSFMASDSLQAGQNWLKGYTKHPQLIRFRVHTNP